MKYKFTLTQHLYSLNYFLKRHFALRLLEKFKRTFKQGKFFVLNVSNFNNFLFFFIDKMLLLPSGAPGIIWDPCLIGLCIGLGCMGLCIPFPPALKKKEINTTSTHL